MPTEPVVHRHVRRPHPDDKDNAVTVTRPGGPLPQILKFNGFGKFADLLSHSLYTVLYRDELYSTALHLFEARRFLDHRPDLADRIRECKYVEDVTSISAELAEFTRRDWDNVGLFIVS
jgi:hypothetical protein